MRAVVFLLTTVSVASHAGTIYLCKSYAGGAFWSSGHCQQHKALIERIVPVPDGIPFSQQVALGEQARAEGARLVPYREKNRAAKFFRRLRGDADGDDASMVQWNPHRALINHIRNECDKLESPTVVFTLDEAQNLTVTELDILKEVTEELIGHRLRPFVLLMAQEEMSFFADWLRENQRRDLLHRFMLHHHRFRGLIRADVDAVLQHLDTATWPEGSHITYTQHFLPSLWKGGWRIAESGELLWAAFERHGQKLGFEPATLEVGTQVVCASSLLLLRRIQEASR